MKNIINTNKHALVLGIISIFTSFVLLTPSYAHAGNFFGDLWGDITNGAGDVAQGVADFGGDVWKGSGQAITQVGSWGGDVWKGAGQTISWTGGIAGDVWNGAGQVATQVGSWGGDLWNGAGQVATQVGSWGGDIVNAGSNVWGDVTNWGGGNSQVATAGWTNTNTNTNTNSNTNTNANYSAIQNNQASQNNSSGTSCSSGSSLSASEAMSAFQSGAITVSFNRLNSSQAQTIIVNNTNCQLPATVWSFKVYDNVTFDTQRQFDNTGMIIIPAHSSHTFTTPLAPCLTQVDALYDSGSVATSALFKGIIFGTDGRSFNSIPSSQGQFCTDTPPPTPNPSLSISCSANPNSVQVGNTINWSANASGGNGNYTYSWSGTDGLSGGSQTVSKSYSNVGSKNATVTVTSGTQSATANCYGNVYQVQDYNYYYGGWNSGGGWNNYYYPYNYSYNESLSGSCSAGVTNTSVGSTVTWTATPMGGNGFYTYYWYGDEGLSSNSQYAPKTYSYGGTKTATVMITSNGQSITRTCSVNVGQVLSYTQTNPLVSSVYLSQIPYTGAGDVAKVALFVAGLIAWSGAIAYIFLKRKEKENQMLAMEIVTDNKAPVSESTERITELKNAIHNEHKDISLVEDYARLHKVIISADASAKLVKLSKLGKVNASEIIRKTAEKAGGEWTTLGEKEVENYLG